MHLFCNKKKIVLFACNSYCADLLCLELTNCWLTNGRHIIILLLHQLMAFGGQISKYRWHIDVFLNRCTNEAATQVTSQWIDFVSVQIKNVSLKKIIIYANIIYTYALTTAWSIRSILFWTITVGTSPHSFSTFIFQSLTASNDIRSVVLNVRTQACAPR